MTFKESPGCCAELAWLLAKRKLRAQLCVWPMGPGFVEKERNPIGNPTLGLQWASEDEGSRCWALMKLLKNVCVCVSICVHVYSYSGLFKCCRHPKVTHSPTRCITIRMNSPARRLTSGGQDFHEDGEHALPKHKVFLYAIETQHMCRPHCLAIDIPFITHVKLPTWTKCKWEELEDGEGDSMWVWGMGLRTVHAGCCPNSGREGGGWTWLQLSIVCCTLNPKGTKKWADAPGGCWPGGIEHNFLNDPLWQGLQLVSLEIK